MKRRPSRDKTVHPEPPAGAPSPGRQAPPQAPTQAASHSERKPKPRPSTPPAGLDVKQKAQYMAELADRLRKNQFAIFLRKVLHGEEDNQEAYKLLLDGVLKDAGDPTDPIERMMIEQLVMAHYRIGLLHHCAESSEGLEARKVYNAVASRLLGEFRRTALALRAYSRRVPDSTSTGEVRLFKQAQ